jgi:hypothetical protein
MEQLIGWTGTAFKGRRRNRRGLPKRIGIPVKRGHEARLEGARERHTVTQA